MDASKSFKLFSKDKWKGGMSEYMIHGQNRMQINTVMDGLMDRQNDECTEHCFFTERRINRYKEDEVVECYLLNSRRTPSVSGSCGHDDEWAQLKENRINQKACLTVKFCVKFVHVYEEDIIRNT